MRDYGKEGNATGNMLDGPRCGGNITCMDDLTAQVAQLQQEQNHLLNSINSFKKLYMNLEPENMVLRVAQKNELCHRLQSLDDIINNFNNSKFNDNNKLMMWFYETTEPAARLQTCTSTVVADQHDGLIMNDPGNDFADMLLQSDWCAGESSWNDLADMLHERP